MQKASGCCTTLNLVSHVCTQVLHGSRDAHLLVAILAQGSRSRPCTCKQGPNTTTSLRNRVRCPRGEDIAPLETPARPHGQADPSRAVPPRRTPCRPVPMSSGSSSGAQAQAKLSTPALFDAAVQRQYPLTTAALSNVPRIYRRPRPGWNAPDAPTEAPPEQYPQPQAQQAEARLMAQGARAVLRLAVSCWLDETEDWVNPLLLWIVDSIEGPLPQRTDRPRWQEDGGLHVSLVRFSDLERDARLRGRAVRVAQELTWTGTLRFLSPFSRGHVGFLDDASLPSLLSYDALWCVYVKGGGDAHISF